MSNSNFWQGRTVLVAGATGFLGGWLVSRLLEYRANVVAVVRAPKPESQFYLNGLDKRVHVATGSVAESAFMEDLFRRYPETSVFYHCAYGADVNRVLRDPLDCYHSAAESTWVVLDLLRRKYPSCIAVVSSTDKVYGNQPVPYHESSFLNPKHPYEVAKAAQDLIAQSYGKVYGLPTVITRCGNYFGGYDFNFTRLIPGMMKDLFEGKRPELRSDGRFKRDFLYIEDAVEVQLMIAEAVANDRTLYGEAFNFSYGVELEVIDIIRRLAELTGKPIEPIVRANARAEIPHMQLSSQKAKERLGWRPLYDFDEGLRRAVRWYSGYFSNQKVGTAYSAVAMIGFLQCVNHLVSAIAWVLEN
jgi:dTDP-glucose 4,6-dehydratase